jgi:hypothetical protein
MAREIQMRHRRFAHTQKTKPLPRDHHKGSLNRTANDCEENVFGGFCVPVSADHTLQVLSLEAVISLLPSGENCTRGTNM